MARTVTGVRAAAVGAGSGVAATIVMTGVLLAARRAGLVDQPAPEVVTTGALQELCIDDDVRPPARTGLVAVGHLGYGALMGALYAAIGPRLAWPPVARGLTYGLALWGVGYAGWIPALGLLPPPERQGTGRNIEAISGHLAYGACLSALEARVGRGGREARRRRS